MPLYANYVPNPNFELGTTQWESESGGTLSRVAANAASGTYALKITNTASQHVSGGVRTTVAIEPGAPGYTLSLTIKAITENHGNAFNAGVTVTVYDLLPGAAMGTRVQVATATYAYTTSARVALRNMHPRASADRLVIVVTTASLYYQAGSTTTTYGSYQNYTDGPVGGGDFIVVSKSQYDTMLSSPNWQGSTTSTTGSQRFGSFRTVSTTTTPTVSGGTSTAHIDAVQIEQAATETPYVDGGTTGYAWSGAAHNSATRAMVQAQADAVASSTGTVSVYLLLPLSSDATAVSTGTVEGSLNGPAASGSASSTGTIEVWQYGPMSATATATSDGGIEIAALIHIELTGEAVSEGSLTVGITMITFADGESISTGTIDIGLPPDMIAEGTATSVGTIEVAIAGVMSATAFAVSVGTLDVSDAVPVGAFTDFAIFGVTENDPLMSVTAVSNGGTNTGATGAEWVRIHAEFTAPAETYAGTTRLWKRAAYAVPGIRFTALPAGSWQEFTRVQLEIAQPAGGPTAYIDGGSIRPLVYPDRMNLAPSVITISIPAVPTLFSASPITSPITDDTAFALSVPLSPGNDYVVTSIADRLKPGAAYTISMYVRGSTNLTDVGFTIHDPLTLAALSEPVSYTDSSDDPVLGGGWRRISAVCTVPASGAVTLVFHWTITQPQVGIETFAVAGFLVEEGIELKPYFFNPENDPEITYHSGASDPSGGVFHYMDRERKAYILNEALRDHVPSGIGIGEPEYGLIPHYDS